MPDQALLVGDVVDVPFTASDPDGDPLTAVAASDNQGVVAAFVAGPGTLNLTANGPGSATVTVTVEDGRGGTASTSFAVTVEQPAPPTQAPPGQVNMADVPFVSALEGPVLQTIRDIHQRGRGMPSPVNPGVFSTAGDTPPSGFLAALADGQANFGDIDNAAQYQAVLAFYTATPLPVDGGNSFASGGLLSSAPGWTAGDLLAPINAPQGCPDGDSPLVCELRTNRPAVVLVFVGRNDALQGTPRGQFKNSVTQIVETTINGGAIPVLTSIPGPPDVVGAYNTVLYTTATDYNIPFLNVWRGVNTLVPDGVIKKDLTLTRSDTPDQLTPQATRSYGAATRDLLAVEMLRQLIDAVPLAQP